ncbi:MAG: GntR family transcriptional regulator [Pseudomonadota bacterium]
MTALIRPKSLTELVTAEVRRWIVEGELDLGAPLSEARVAKALEVSRTPVREAINRLEIEGLLKTEPQRGTFVFNLAADELAKICDVRVCLETAALRAVMNANPKPLAAAFKRHCKVMVRARDTGDDAAYLREDTAFHQSLIDCADNRFLADAYHTIAAKMAALRNRLGGHPDHMAKSHGEHLEILAAVSANDLAAAVETLTHHIDRKEGSYWTLASATPTGVARRKAGVSGVV